MQKIDETEADKQIEVTGGQIDASTDLSGAADALIQADDGGGGHSITSLI